MVQSERLKAIIKEVQEESTPVIQLSNKLIEAYSNELDSAISELNMIMESIIKVLEGKADGDKVQAGG